jgi:hypothetical protein
LIVWLLALLAAAPAPKTLHYWIEPSTYAGDPELAAWAMRAWESASAGLLRLPPATNRDQAEIQLVWASGQQGLYGEARPIRVNGRRGWEVAVLPAPLAAADDPLLRDAVVYLTCLHETGHALGLPHTAQFDDIMYSFQYGGDIPAYFDRYRRKLRSRGDISKNSGLSEGDRKSLAEALAAKN